MARPWQIVRTPPLTVHTRCPEIAKLGVPFTLTLVVENHTTSLQVRSPRHAPLWMLSMHAWCPDAAGCAFPTDTCSL